METNSRPSAYELARRSVEALGPADRLRLIAELANALSRQAEPPRRRYLRELRGLGKELWEGIDTDEYLRQERASWDG